jgi:S-adenosylmethionine:tRNA ribosyltransferase-isomerase
VIAEATECFAAHELRDVAPVERDDVALLVSRKSDGALVSACFDELGDFLKPGDVLVVNTSATLPAAIPADLHGGSVELHLSTHVSGPDWVVEVRTTDQRPHRAPRTATVLHLPDDARAEILAPYLGSTRLAIARLDLGMPVDAYLARHGQPIRYPHSPAGLGIDAYQTVFARDPGSAEMPSAARPFSPELVARLGVDGVRFAPLTLHCGVSSLEAGESPYPERYRVPAATARLVNSVRWWGGRVIAVGTTVVRALESAADRDGVVSAADGLTSLVVSPERGVRDIDGLITGWHEPDSSHLRLLESVAGPELLRRAYAAADSAGYRFHEFGDSHLILP